MKRVALLPLALAAGVLHAGPRGDVAVPEPATPEQVEARRLKMAEEMAAWLPRLVGRFRFEGIVDFNDAPTREPPDPQKIKSAKGLGDCVAVGTGPGVHCVVNVVWPEEWNPQGEARPGGASFLAPASILYGIDAATSTIRYLQLDTDGLVMDGTAVLEGDTLRWTFAGYCVGKPQVTCGQDVKIYAPPDGKFIQMFIEITGDPRRGLNLPVATFNLYMHRVPQVPGKASKDAPAKK